MDTITDSSSSFRFVTSADVVRVWKYDIASAKCSMQTEFCPHQSQINCVRWNHNSQVLASCGDDGAICLTHHNGDNLGRLPKLWSPDNRPPRMNTITFSQGSRYLCSGGADTLVKVWDLKRQILIRKWKQPIQQAAEINTVCFSSKDTHVASGDSNGVIMLHSMQTGSTLPGVMKPVTATHTGISKKEVTSMQYSPFLVSNLATGYSDGSVVVWETSSGQTVSTFYGPHSAPVTGLSWSKRNRDLLCTCALDSAIQFFDVRQSKAVRRYETSEPLTATSFHPDGVTLLTGTASGRVFIYDLRIGNHKQAPLGDHNLHPNHAICWLELDRELKKDRRRSQLPTKSKQNVKLSSNSSKSNLAGQSGRYDMKSTSDTKHKVCVNTVQSNIQNNKTQNQDKVLNERSENVEIPQSVLHRRNAKMPPQPPTTHKPVVQPVESGFQNSSRSSALLDPMVEPTAVHARVNEELQTNTYISGINNNSKDSHQLSNSSINIVPECRTETNDKSPIRLNDQLNALLNAATQNHRLQNNTMQHKVKNTKQSMQHKVKNTKQLNNRNNDRNNNDTNNCDLLNAGNKKEGVQLGWQLEFLQNHIEDNLNDMRDEIHEEVQGLHLEVIRQFQIQKQEMRKLMQSSLDQMAQVVSENTRLRNENDFLRHMH